ncbi:hypothetical protein P280DRAFT_467339 [Massarina eburnea CBS 473.64]|uniref:alpha-galactosidase n=1 Tax=Massarina eburnea CBS 473.64 TaxID=1395130 RepID=A0A6A6S7T4_9PLEO|nr:hypothetical protein P280DRAFT_467339 [Massarina eburnea CBS 473.64]
MFISPALVLAGTVSLTAAHPFRETLSRRAITAFPAGTSFDILLNKGSTNVKTISSNTAFSVIDIDLFDNDAATIADLRSADKKVICYFSAGTREDWREDKGSFQSSDYGNAMEDWEGENWVNVKSENVKAIMKKRITMAKEKGCDAVDPDNVDGFSGNQDGWGYQQADYADYVKYLATESASAGLAIGLKNALDLIPDVLDVVQFAVNEQCHEYSECIQYKPFTTANKAVFNIEYGGNECASPAGVTLTILNKSADQALNTLGGQCSVEAPAASLPAASSSAKATASATKSVASSTVVGKPPVTTTSAASKPSVTLNTSVTAAPSTTAVATDTSAIWPSKTTSAAKPTKTASDEDEDEDEDDDEDGDDEGEEEKPHRHGSGRSN